ncbi:MAG: hypothetical protein ACTSRS_08395 [Candidatus Helarchaeota archaeon]
MTEMIKTPHTNAQSLERLLQQCETEDEAIELIKKWETQGKITSIQAEKYISILHFKGLTAFKHKKIINYDNFLLSLFTNRKIPYLIWIILLFLGLYVIPRILYFEFVLNISWTNFFYINYEYMAVFPMYFTISDPHVDVINVFAVIIGIPALFSLKLLYNSVLEISDFFVDNIETKDLEEQYLWDGKDETEKFNKKLAERKAETRQLFDQWIHLIFKKLPKIAIIGGLIFIPLLTIFFWDWSKFFIDFYLTILLEIPTLMGFCFFFILLAITIIVIIGCVIIIVKSTKIDLFLNILHPDKCAGLKKVERFTLKYLYIWTLISFSYILIASTNVFLESTQSYLSLWLFLAIGAIAFSVFIFFTPLFYVHKMILREKAQDLAWISSHFDQKQINALSTLNSDEIAVNTLLSRINILTWLDFYATTRSIREWPWDTSIIYKVIFSLGIPIITIVVQMLIL